MPRTPRDLLGHLYRPQKLQMQTNGHEKRIHQIERAEVRIYIPLTFEEAKANEKKLPPKPKQSPVRKFRPFTITPEPGLSLGLTYANGSELAAGIDLDGKAAFVQASYNDPDGPMTVGGTNITASLQGTVDGEFTSVPHSWDIHTHDEYYWVLPSAPGSLLQLSDFGPSSTARACIITCNQPLTSLGFESDQDTVTGGSSFSIDIALARPLSTDFAIFILGTDYDTAVSLGTLSGRTPFDSAWSEVEAGSGVLDAFGPGAHATTSGNCDDTPDYTESLSMAGIIVRPG